MLLQTDREEMRRALIRLALKRQSKGTGSTLSFLKARTTQMEVPDLNVSLLSIRYAVVGAVATRLYMPERMTQDLDVLVHLRDGQNARNLLEKAGATYQGELSIGGSSWILSERFPIDVLESGEAWLDVALEEAQSNRDVQGLPVLPLPYLILMKFQASRMQDIADVTRMLGQASEAQQREIRELFSRWLPADIEDLESLLILGRMEFE